MNSQIENHSKRKRYKNLIRNEEFDAENTPKSAKKEILGKERYINNNY